MKNLMIYINPRKDFDHEGKVTVKIQIDNSLDLGWKREDIILVTNFPYKYHGIKALIVGDECFSHFDPAMSKTNAIIDLLRKKITGTPHNKGGGEIYFFHDLDVFQNEVITTSEIESELGTADLGLTDKGRMPRWNFGTLFFKKDARDIFEKTMEIANKYKTTDEIALLVLYTNNLLWATEPEPEKTIGNRLVPVNTTGTGNVSKRIKKINITYNFRRWNIRSCYKMAVKPIRIVHFHPFVDLELCLDVPLDFFMNGKNKINTVLMSKRLIKIFNQHGIYKLL